MISFFMVQIKQAIFSCKKRSNVSALLIKVYLNSESVFCCVNVHKQMIQLGKAMSRQGQQVDSFGYNSFG